MAAPVAKYAKMIPKRKTSDLNSKGPALPRWLSRKAGGPVLLDIYSTCEAMVDAKTADGTNRPRRWAST